MEGLLSNTWRDILAIVGLLTALLQMVAIAFPNLFIIKGRQTQPPETTTSATISEPPRAQSETQKTNPGAEVKQEKANAPKPKWFENEEMGNVASGVGFFVLINLLIFLLSYLLQLDGVRYATIPELLVTAIVGLLAFLQLLACILLGLVVFMEFDLREIGTNAPLAFRILSVSVLVATSIGLYNLSDTPNWFTFALSMVLISLFGGSLSTTFTSLFFRKSRNQNASR